MCFLSFWTFLDFNTVCDHCANSISQILFVGGNKIESFFCLEIKIQSCTSISEILFIGGNKIESFAVWRLKFYRGLS